MSEEKRFMVGDEIYVSEFGNKQIELDCPVCFRKGVVTLILGNGDSVEMPCEYCKSGLGTPSKGYVNEWIMDAGVKKVTITEVIIKQTAEGNKFDYLSHSHIYYTKDVFATEKEALEESRRRADKYNLERETKAEFIKGKPDKNYSWNAGYHMSLAKKAKMKVEYHTKMAKICKGRASK
jgi:hypothetical protein